MAVGAPLGVDKPSVVKDPNEKPEEQGGLLGFKLSSEACEKNFLIQPDFFGVEDD